MRFAKPHTSRRGAFLFIALFSCLQITLGFFLINGNGNDSVLSDDIYGAMSLAQSEPETATPLDLNAIEPASGDITDETINQTNDEEDIITKKLIESLSNLSTVE